MSGLRKYETMILLTEEFNDSELKTWVFNYAKNLRKFSVCDISVISRGKHNLAYSINDIGLINPVYVIENKNKKYKILSGFRRLSAIFYGYEKIEEKRLALEELKKKMPSITTSWRMPF